MGELEKLLEQKKRIEERIRTAQARETKKARADDTRKKILLGAFIAQKDSWLKKIIESPDFEKFITRNIDRKLFGLTEIATAEIEEEKQETQTQNSKSKAGTFAIKPDLDDL